MADRPIAHLWQVADAGQVLGVVSAPTLREHDRPERIIAAARCPYTCPGVPSPVDWRALWAAFGLVLIAELGDNMQ